MKRHPKLICISQSSSDYSSSVRKTAQDVATEMGFDDDRVFDVAMAVEEAYVNAIEHGNFVSGKTKLEIKFFSYEDRLEVLINDTGCGFDSKKVNIPRHLGAVDSVRGRGLSLISNLSDDFKLVSCPGKGTRVKIINYLWGRHK